MCLINIAFHYHADYPFICIANRDEFYNRPTQPLHWWNEQIIAGKDLQDGGTWMGMTKTGRIAALTNYRDIASIKKDVPSRGGILKKYLSSELSLDNMHAYLIKEGHIYNGFNIIYGTIDSLFFYSNITGKILSLSPGIYGLSNALLDTPWMKVTESKKQFKKILNMQSVPDENKLLTMFHNTTIDTSNILPTTGVSEALERKLSAMFVQAENYGSRLTTFISVNKKRHVIYREKSYVPINDVRFEFTMSNSNLAV